MTSSETRHQKDILRRRRGVYFKQLLDDLHITHGKFTDQVNNHIQQNEYHLSDSKKISDWIANGIPGPRTPMKSRIRQLAVIAALGIQRNSDQHKMLTGRIPVSFGILDRDDHSQMPPENAPPDPAGVPHSDDGTPDRRRKIGLVASALAIVIVVISVSVLRISASQKAAVFAGSKDISHTTIVLENDAPLGGFGVCPIQGSYASPPSVIKAKLTLVNRTRETDPLQVYWIDFDGNTIGYTVLGKAPVNIDTFVGHIWMIKNQDGACFHKVLIGQ